MHLEVALFHVPEVERLVVGSDEDVPEPGVALLEDRRLRGGRGRWACGHDEKCDEQDDASKPTVHGIIVLVSDFPHSLHIRVRFQDCDPMGHCNNAVYSTYLEEARIGMLGGLESFILARVEIDFRAELRAGDEVEVRSRCPRVGTKSFELEHELHSAGTLVAEARSVLVSYDYGLGESVPVPDELRARLAP